MGSSVPSSWISTASTTSECSQATSEAVSNRIGTVRSSPVLCGGSCWPSAGSSTMGVEGTVTAPLIGPAGPVPESMYNVRSRMGSGSSARRHTKVPGHSARSVMPQSSGGTSSENAASQSGPIKRRSTTGAEPDWERWGWLASRCASLRPATTTEMIPSAADSGSSGSGPRMHPKAHSAATTVSISDPARSLKTETPPQRTESSAFGASTPDR